MVVVCGWYGALDKHVVKYTDVMKSWGCATLRTIMPGHLVFSPLSAGRSAYARDLLAATRAARAEHNLTDAPLYFMFMSNGGCWLWAAINDDGPCVPTAPSQTWAPLLRASSSRLSRVHDPHLRRGSPLPGQTTSLAPPGPSVLPRGCRDGSDVASLRRKLRGRRPESSGARSRAPRRRALPVQRHDLLCDADKVAELIDERRRLDPEVPIEMVRWNVSRHCTHLVDRREEYERTLRAFLRA